MIFLIFSCRANSNDVNLNQEFEAYAWVDGAALKNYDLNSATLETFRRLGILEGDYPGITTAPGETESQAMLPARWLTSRLSVADSTLAELEELQQVDEACAYIKAWTGELAESRHAQPMLWALQGGDLPPRGSKERFRLQSIRMISIGQLMGYIEIYHDYPVADIFWVGFLGIHPAYQNQGYGQEVVQA